MFPLLLTVLGINVPPMTIPIRAFYVRGNIPSLGFSGRGGFPLNPNPEPHNVAP